MTRDERLALVDKLRADRARTEADRAERAARPEAARQRLAELAAGADGSPSWRRQWNEVLDALDEPLPAPHVPPGPASEDPRMLRRDYGAPRTMERPDMDDESLIGALADAVGEVTGRHERELAELRAEVAALKCDLQIMRAGNLAKFNMIGRRNAA
jgi:hypothetical protein